MKKLVFLLSLGACILVYACGSDQKKTEKEVINQDGDSSEQKVTVSSGRFVPPDSTYSGDYFEKYPNGVIKVRGTFRFGKKSGKWMYFYPTGIIWSEAFYKNDVMHGESTVYHENGQKLYTGYYNMDKADSIWNFYDSTGKLVRTKDYNKIKVDKK